MSRDVKGCFCGADKSFIQCCQPLIEKQQVATDAEALMRSRYSAYVIANYQYILHTYALAQQKQLSVGQLAQSAKGTKWLALEVLEHKSQSETAKVEFKAYYQVDNQFYLMHELSDFILEQNNWRYTQGNILTDSGQVFLKRNDPCICQSNKKFKKCCGKYI